jgi:hypothetical protein
MSNLANKVKLMDELYIRIFNALFSVKPSLSQGKYPTTHIE